MTIKIHGYQCGDTDNDPYLPTEVYILLSNSIRAAGFDQLPFDFPPALRRLAKAYVCIELISFKIDTHLTFRYTTRDFPDAVCEVVI